MKDRKQWQLEVEGKNPSAQYPNGENLTKDSAQYPNGENLTKDSEDSDASTVSYSLSPAADSYLDTFPPGYRFKPYDGELLVHYLQKKILNEPLPPNRIKVVELYRFSPKELAESCKALGEKEWYFFTPRDRKYPNGHRPNRTATDGYWKAIGADKPVKYNDNIVGFKKSLVFYKGKAPKGNKANWIMHEYRVNSPPKIRSNQNDMRLDDWVLCRIQHKNKSGTHKLDNSVQEQQIEGETQTTANKDSTQISVEVCQMRRAEIFKPEGHGSVDMAEYYNQRRFFNEYDDMFLSCQSPYVNFPHCLGSQDLLPTFVQSYHHHLWFNHLFNENCSSSLDESSSPGLKLLPQDYRTKPDQLGYHPDEYLNLPSEDNCFDPLAHNFMNF